MQIDVESTGVAQIGVWSSATSPMSTPCVQIVRHFPLWKNWRKRSYKANRKMMTTSAPLLDFGREVTGNPRLAAQRERLVTNGIGGFALDWQVAERADERVAKLLYAGEAADGVHTLDEAGILDEFFAFVAESQVMSFWQTYEIRISHKMNREVVLLTDQHHVYDRLFEVFVHDWKMSEQE